VPRMQPIPSALYTASISVLDGTSRTSVVVEVENRVTCRRPEKAGPAGNSDTRPVICVPFPMGLSANTELHHFHSQPSGFWMINFRIFGERWK
jgi:hypothetical protein